MSEPMQASIIERSAERLFADHVTRETIERAETGVFEQSLWDAVEAAGFTRALVHESAGGAGLNLAAAFPILQHLGASAAPIPLAETMLATHLLACAGVEIPPGAITLLDGADLHEAASRVSGRAVNVPWARDCAWGLAALHGGRSIALVSLRAGDHLQITHGTDLAGMPSDQVVLKDCPLHAAFENPFPQSLDPTRSLGATARSAMMVGSLSWVLGQCVQYANDRVQFGRPIGRYQAIQHQLAVMAGDVAAARMAALVAANDAPDADNRQTVSADFSAAVAKIRAGEAATRAASIAHQVHGAFGFTKDHTLHFATRRLWAWREAYGSDAWWAQRLGRAAIAAGGDAFWPSVTSRTFPQPVLATERSSKA